METKENQLYVNVKKCSDYVLYGFVPDSALIDASLIQRNTESCREEVKAPKHSAYYF